jgi:membrane protein
MAEAEEKVGRTTVSEGIMERTRSTLQRHPAGRFVVLAISRFLEEYVIGLAQQIAFNLLFSVAPLLIFLTACISLLAHYLNRELESPIQPILDWVYEQVPANVAAVIEEPLRQALDTDASALLSLGGVLALWSAKNAVASTMRGLNATYGIREVRPFLAHNTVAVFLTLGMVVSVLVISLLQLLGTRIGEQLANEAGLSRTWNQLIEDLQWPVTLFVLVLMTVVLHRLGPTFRGPFLWYLPGAVFTILGIIVATWGFGKYFEFTSGFSAYGAFGAVLALMVWLYIVSLVVLLGGLINGTLFQTFPPAQRALEAFRASHPNERRTLDQLRREARELIRP